MTRGPIVALGLALAFAISPQVVYAQEKPARIGSLLSGSPKTHGHNLVWFLEGMHDLRYIEGRDYVIIPRWGMGKRKRLPELAKELVKDKVDLILTAGGASIRAAGKATQTIPIVVGSAGNLGGYGFVKSFTKPGGNVTGSTMKGAALHVKRLGLLKETLPTAQQIAFLHPRSSKRIRRELKRMKTAGGKLRLKILALEARNIATIRRAFESNGDPDALIINTNPEFNAQRQALAALAIERQIPTMCQQEAYAQAGCLISYTVDRQRMWHRAASFVDRILKGANPAELPVELATRYELVVNLKTAKALELKIPRSVLLQATKVIE